MRLRELNATRASVLTMATTYGFANRLTLRRHGHYVAVATIDKTGVRHPLRFPTREEAVEGDARLRTTRP